MPVVYETHQLGKRALALGCECGQCLFWVMGGKTRSEYMFSELPQIADIIGAPAARTA